MSGLLLLNFIIPGVMLLMSVMLKKRKMPYPGPGGSMKWKIDFSGYNTPLARRSPAHWDYAQTIAPEVFLRKGKLALLFAAVFAVLGFVSRNGVEAALICGMGFGFVMINRAFAEVECRLKERFGT